MLLENPRGENRLTYEKLEMEVGWLLCGVWLIKLSWWLSG